MSRTDLNHPCPHRQLVVRLSLYCFQMTLFISVVVVRAWKVDIFEAMSAQKSYLMGPARYILVLFLQQIWQADFVSLWKLKALLKRLKDVVYFVPLSSSSISYAARLNFIRYDALLYLSCDLFIIVSNLGASSELLDHRCNDISVSCLRSLFF